MKRELIGNKYQQMRYRPMMHRYLKIKIGSFDFVSLDSI
jgi:hypothetical protein